MKRIFALIIAINSLCGCLNEKDYAESAIVPSQIVGEWVCRIEEAGEHNYVFNEDGTCTYEYTYLDEFFGARWKQPNITIPSLKAFSHLNPN